ncbi:hypothetical protein LZ198_30965 [Myxococcus sp. K15C18031901]|uniref:hypothetical protein n=1 Tax=Myxococcus dinghuensis TaxID=2906761 RepID=UPI0020A72787|nr:hypothetical protein [Myxococcus dinghuensis]MCP3103312.1 hypothetical protein [Myxococcus dinghuensis]
MNVRMQGLKVQTSPRARLFGAVVLVVGLSLLGPLGGASGVAGARVLLALVALATLGWWWHRRGVERTHVPAVERMRVISREGLSPRCGVALVEVEGRGFLVAYGDAFAEIHPLQGREEEGGLEVMARARRLRPRWRMPQVSCRGQS